MARKRKPNKSERFVAKNVSGSSRSGQCKPWIKHWEKFLKLKRPKKCSVLGCSKPLADGAHVISQDGRTDKCWWIAPMCVSCNRSKHKEEMELDVRVTLVLAR